MDDKSMNQSLNVGTEVDLGNGIIKHIKIGSVALIKEVRAKMKGVKYRYQFGLGRGKEKIGEDEYDFDQEEKAYQELFGLVLAEGLTDEEYNAANVEELDKLLDRFL